MDWNNTQVDVTLHTHPVLCLGGSKLEGAGPGTASLWHLLKEHEHIRGFPNRTGVIPPDGAAPFSGEAPSVLSNVVTPDTRRSLVNQWAYFWDRSTPGLFSSTLSPNRRDRVVLMQRAHSNMVQAPHLQRLLTLGGSSKVNGIFFLFLVRHPLAVAVAQVTHLTARHWAALEGLVESWLSEHELLNTNRKQLKKHKVHTWRSAYLHTPASPPCWLTLIPSSFAGS